MKKYLALALALVMVIGLLASCGGKKEDAPVATNPPAATTVPPVSTIPPTDPPPPDKGGDIVHARIAPEPETIDPTYNTSVDGMTYIVHMFEGLIKFAQDGSLTAGMAESWDISPDGKTYTFHLRDANWFDGRPVTAHDFVYSWKRAVTPEIQYNYMFDPVLNAIEIYSWEEGEPEPGPLGIEAVGDKTLIVRLAEPCGYFLDLCAFPTYLPLRQDIVEANPNAWATNPATYIGNGAFKLKQWVHDSVIILEKNQDYYDAATIMPAEIHWHLSNDENVTYAAFKAGEWDYIQGIPLDLLPDLLASGEAKRWNSLGWTFQVFNTAVAPFDDVKVREAFVLALDREHLCDNIFGVGNIPAAAIVPGNIPDVNAQPDFRTVGRDFFNPMSNGYEANKARAKQLMAEAGYPNGEGLGRLEFKYNPNTNNDRISEYCQAMWKEVLGVDVDVVPIEWNVFLQVRRDMDFQFARHGWVGDYTDPMTFLDMFITDGGNNQTNWSNPEYDRLIQIGKTASDRAERMDAMHKAEALAMGDWIVNPLWFGAVTSMQKPELIGPIYIPTGQTMLMWAYFD